MLKNNDIVQQLNKSQIYRDYEWAFGEATKMPLTLRAREIWQHALVDKTNQNPFCSLLAQSNKSCAACLEVQQKIVECPEGESKTVTCFAGLCDTAVPVRVGQEIIGYLQTGQIALEKPNRARFAKITRQMLEWGSKVDLRKLEEAYFHSRVLTEEQHGAMVRLLEIFAQHLSTCANQILVRKENAEPPMITQAKRYIGEHQAEELSLEQTAQALHVSVFYFCKMFKKATGLTFTDYLSRIRIERAKNLLINPNVRVSEAAYDCGFASLTHFNRVFKRVVGTSPTSYRQTLAR